MAKTLTRDGGVYPPALPPFESGTWKWDGAADYEGDRIHPQGLWLVRRRDPFSASPGTQRTLAQDFEYNAASKLKLAVDAFVGFTEALRENRLARRRLREIVSAIDNEITVVRRSFERANNHPFRLHFTNDVLHKASPAYDLECRAAKLFFQLDQLRNCTKQDSRAYTIEQFDVIYSTLRQLRDDLIWEIESNFNTTIKRKMV